MTTVLFDLDGTLLDRQNSLRVYFHRQIERFPDLLAGVPFMPYLERFMELDAHGHGDKEAAWTRIEEEFALPAGSDALLRRDYHAHFPVTCVPFPRLHQTLAACRQRGWKLGIITNGKAPSQDPKIDGLGIRPYFDAVLISAVEGIKKPDAAIYARALERLGGRADAAVMVGDNPHADIAGAQDAGLKAVWKKDPYWPRPEQPDAVIDDLEELPAAIDRIS